MHDGDLSFMEAAGYYLTLLLAGPGAATTISTPATAGSNPYHIQCCTGTTHLGFSLDRAQIHQLMATEFTIWLLLLAGQASTAISAHAASG